MSIIDTILNENPDVRLGYELAKVEYILSNKLTPMLHVSEDMFFYVKELLGDYECIYFINEDNIITILGYINQN